MTEKQLRIAYYYGVCLLCIATLLGSSFFFVRSIAELWQTWGWSERAHKGYEEAERQTEQASNRLDKMIEKYHDSDPLGIIKFQESRVESSRKHASDMMQNLFKAMDGESKARFDFLVNLGVVMLAVALWLIHWRFLKRAMPSGDA